LYCRFGSFLVNLDHNHSNGQVIFTYPQKYWEVANSRAHHLIKYMEYKNGPPALHWFNYAGLAAALEMLWNKEEECPVPWSKSKLTAIAAMTFDWLDCLDLAQIDVVDQPQIDTDDLSVLSFDTGHIPGKQGAVDDNSLATAQTSVAGTVEEETDSALASTTVQGAKTLVPVDVDADDLASMENSIYSPCSSSGSLSSSSQADHPDLATDDPLEEMETGPPNEEPDPDATNVAMLDSSTVPLQSVGDQQQTLGDGPPTAPPRNPLTWVLLWQAQVGG